MEDCCNEKRSEICQEGVFAAKLEKDCKIRSGLFEVSFMIRETVSKISTLYESPFSTAVVPAKLASKEQNRLTIMSIAIRSQLNTVLLQTHSTNVARTMKAQG